MKNVILPITGDFYWKVFLDGFFDGKGTYSTASTNRANQPVAPGHKKAAPIS